MSPVLVLSALEEFLSTRKKDWSEKRLGITIGEGSGKLTNLRFADDLLLVATSLAELTKMIEKLSQEVSEFGLAIHPQKTKVLGNVADSRRTPNAGFVSVGGLNIEILSFDGHVKYLGRRFSFSNTSTLEVDNKINSGWDKFHMFRHVLCNRRSPLGQRLKFFDASVTPSVLYACETWTTTTELQHRLRKTQRHMLRLMMKTGQRKMQP